MKSYFLINLFSLFFILQSTGQSNYLWLRADNVNCDDVLAVSCAPQNYSYANWDVIHPYSTNGGGCVNRVFINFHVDNYIPSNATVLSAKLNFYWCNTSLVSPSYHQENGTNDLTVSRVMAPWTESTLKWNNMPLVTNVNAVAVPPRTFGTENIENIDVTLLVQNMVLFGDDGFRVKLTAETANSQKYVVMASSENADSVLRPLLIIEYVLSSAPAIANFMASDSNLCVNETVDFYDSSLNSPNSWAWSFPGGIPSTSNLQNPQSILYQVSGVYPVTLVASNFNGADSITFNQYINVKPLPVLAMPSDTTLCFGQQIILSPTTNANTYLWQNGSTLSYFSVTSAGTYIVTVTLNGCEISDTTTVNYLACGPPPLVSFSLSDTLICNAQSINLYDSTLNNPTQWQWYFSGGVPGSSSMQNPIGIQYPNAGKYNVTLIASNINGSDTLVYSQAINVLQTPLVNLGNDTSLCLGQQLLLTVTNTNYNYLWQNGSTSFSINVDSTGTYYVESTNQICNSSDTINIIFTPCGSAPLSAFSASDTMLCEKSSIDFFDLSLNNPTSWFWVFQGGAPSFSTLQNPTNIYYASYGQFDVTLIACNAIGCDTITKSAFIVENSQPSAPTIIVSNDTLFCSSAFSYAWYSIQQPAVVLSTNSFFVPVMPGSYYVLITDSNGCQNTSSVYITSSSIGNIPTQSFATIKDDIHGVFVHFNDGNSVSCIINIYDAAGKLIYANNISGMEKGKSVFIQPFLFKSGIYFLHLQTEKQIMVCKLIR